MANWYFNAKGRAVGPVTEQELRDRIGRGDLKALDLVFREGASHWMTVQEFAGDGSSAQWIVLALKEEAGRRSYLQDGPFSLSDVNAKVQSGAVKYSDFVWKPGMSAWTRIGDLPEFNRRLEERPASDKPAGLPKPDIEILSEELGEITRRTVMSQVEEYTPPPTPPAVATPKEADGNDLLEQKTVVGVMPGRKSPAPAAKAMDDVATVIRTKQDLMDQVTPVPERLLNERKMPEKTNSSVPIVESVSQPTSVEIVQSGKKHFYVLLKKAEVLWESLSRKMQMGIVAGVAAVCGVLLVLFVRSGEVSQPEVVVVPEVAQLPAAPVTAVPAAPVMPAPPPKKAAALVAPRPEAVEKNPVRTESLKARVVGSGTFDAKVVVQTHLPAGSRGLKMRLLGRSGQILELPSYLRIMELTWEESEDPSIVFSRLKVPEGLYEVLVTDGSRREQVEVFYGVKSTDFIRRQEQHMRKIAFQQQQEKKFLLSTLDKLDRQIQRFEQQVAQAKVRPATWPKFYKGWQREVNGSVQEISQAIHSQSLAFPLEMDFLSKFARYLASQGQSVNEGLSAARSTAASFPASRLRSVLQGKKTQFLRLSSRR